MVFGVFVSVEVAQLLLNFTERVDELFVAENSGDRFDRGEEIAGERLVVVDHLVNVYLGLDHLGNSLVLSDFLLQLCEVLVVGDNRCDDRLLSGCPQTRLQRPAEEQDQTQWTTSKELLSLHIALDLDSLLYCMRSALCLWMMALKNIEGSGT